MFHVEHNAVHIDTCPICDNSNLKPHHQSLDKTVSKKVFTVRSCSDCGLKITSPRPHTDHLGSYYKSDDYVSHTKSKSGLVNRIYHLVKKRTLQHKLKLIKSINSPESVLDFGCGTGDFLSVCAGSGMQIRGAEPDPIARQNIPEGISSFCSTPEKVLAEKDKYDLITLWHVLEHLPDLTQNMERLIQKLKPGGRLIIAVPNHLSGDALHYKEEWAAWDVPRHLWHFNPQSIQQLMASKNMVVMNTLPMWFDSFYVSMLSENSPLAMLLKAPFVGLASNIRALLHKNPVCSSQIYIIGSEKAV